MDNILGVMLEFKRKVNTPITQSLSPWMLFWLDVHGNLFALGRWKRCVMQWPILLVRFCKRLEVSSPTLLLMHVNFIQAVWLWLP